MLKNQENDIVDKWSALMDEWASASKDLDLALEMAVSIEPAGLPEWQRAVDEARKRQTMIKQRIDEVIKRAMANRSIPEDGLVVGQISKSLTEASTDAARLKVTKRS